MWKIFNMSIGSVVIQSGGNVSQDFSGTSGPVLVGSGKHAVQPRVLSGSFDSLEVSGPAVIEVVCGEGCSIEVHGDDNLVDLLETELVGSALQVGIKRGASFSSRQPLKVVAKAPSIEQVDLSGSGNVLLSALGAVENQIQQIRAMVQYTNEHSMGTDRRAMGQDGTSLPWQAK